jgi:hypothetical protein
MKKYIYIYIIPVVSKHFIVDVALGRVGVATQGRTSHLGGSDGMLRDHRAIFGLANAEGVSLLGDPGACSAGKF